MKRLLAAALLSVAIYVPVASGQNDKAGSKDFPGITRMPDHFIYNFETSPFDALSFRVTKDGKATTERVEGKVVKIQYVTKENIQKPSALQIVRNYQNAVKASGGQVMDDHPGDGWAETTLRLAKGGKETWISIEARSGEYWVKVAERDAMKQDVAVDAASMASGLGTEGKVALYGLYFDTGKSDLKPESDPTLAEIAKLLTANPAMKVLVVGHTDMTGDAAANMTLSMARAQAVVNALVAKNGIAAARLKAFGAGPYAPVASNKTDDGRAKNRRVELVDAAIQ